MQGVAAFRDRADRGTTIADAASLERFEEGIVPEDQPISWRSIVYGTPVTSEDRVLVAGGRGRAQVSRVPASTVPSFER
jgi:hypothetical protein